MIKQMAVRRALGRIHHFDPRGKRRADLGYWLKTRDQISGNAERDEVFLGAVGIVTRLLAASA